MGPYFANSEPWLLRWDGDTCFKIALLHPTGEAEQPDGIARPPFRPAESILEVVPGFCGRWRKYLIPNSTRIVFRKSAGTRAARCLLVPAWRPLWRPYP
jgi:hypothetical protein